MSTGENSAESQNKKKHVGGTSAGSQEVKYISAGAPTGVKKVKDA